MAWHFQQFGVCDQQSLRSACAYAQSDQSLCLSLEYSLSVKLLSEHHLEFLSLKGGCTGSSQSIHVKMPHCWTSHVAAHFICVSSLEFLMRQHKRCFKAQFIKNCQYVLEESCFVQNGPHWFMDRWLRDIDI